MATIKQMLDSVEKQASNFKSFSGKNMAGQNYSDTMANLLAAGYAQLDFVLTNNDNVNAHNIDIFNPMQSSAEISNPNIGETYTAAYAFATGNLVYTYSGQTATISCNQLPYRAFVNFLQVNPVLIGLIRMKFTTQAQMANNIRPFTYSFFGAQNQNAISPLSYFNPNQMQNLIIDIPVPLGVDNEVGFIYRLQPAETVTMSIFFIKWDKTNSYKNTIG